MVIHKFQGIPILHHSINLTLNSKELEFLKNIKWVQNNSNLISSNKHIFQDNRLNRLKNIFKEGADFYIKKILEIDYNLKLLNSWVTLNRKNDFHSIHDHSNVFLSICYYHQIYDGDLIFSSSKSLIQKGYNFDYNIINLNDFNTNIFSIKPKQGDIIIFPGWVFHETSPNKSKKERIMIGANYFIKNKMGSGAKVNELNL